MVLRCEEIENFEPDEFWYIEVEVQRMLDRVMTPVVFNWALERLYCKFTVGFYYMDMLQRSQDKSDTPDNGKYFGTIKSVQKTQVTKYKPKPLNTEQM